MKATAREGRNASAAAARAAGATMRFRDHQATARRSTAGLLLLFAAVLLGLLVAVNGALALGYRLTFPMSQGWPRFFFETNTGLVLLFVLGGCWIESLRLREGGAHVARLAGGQRVEQPRDRRERRLLNVVDELAIASGMRRAPAVYLLPREDGINAFAAGWDLDDAVVGVTRGALERLTRDELQGVLAHEFSHILNEDMRLHMRLIGLVWGLQLIFNFGRLLWEPDERGRHGAAALIGLALLAVGSAGWLAGRLLKAAVSRQREYLADASAVQFTRLADGIGGALRKIADQAREGRDALRGTHAESLSHLFFSTPPGWTRLLATHPPLPERLRRIYGREVGALPAELLGEAEAADAERGPALGLVALRPPAAGFVRSAPARPEAPPAILPPAPEDPARQRRDREAEALRRLQGWQGPRERRAAVLALLLRPGDARQLQLWRELAEGLPHAGPLLADVQALPPAARLPALELLLQRGAGAPAAEAAALQQAAQRLLTQPDGSLRALDRLRWLVLRGPQPRASGPGRDLASLRTPLQTFTAFLAPLLDAPSADAARGPGWHALALQLLEPDAPLPAWQMPADAELEAALQALSALPPLQRPRLAKAWLQAAQRQRGGALPDGEAAEALWLACRLLDTPAPPALVPSLAGLSQASSLPA